MRNTGGAESRDEIAAGFGVPEFRDLAA